MVTDRHNEASGTEPERLDLSIKTEPKRGLEGVGSGKQVF